MDASHVAEKVGAFHAQGLLKAKDTILLFPPDLNSYHRLRIHELVQAYPGLSTQSFGIEPRRQLAVFWADASSTPEVKTTAIKRPTQAVYVPKAKRESPALIEIKARFGPQVHIEPCQLSDQDKLELSNQNIVEIHDFLPELKTGDIIQELTEFRGKYDLKWVDDTHALAKFQSNELMNAALVAEFDKIKIRPLIEGTEQSKSRVHDVYMFHDPTAVRPETSSKVANRLVLNALGLNVRERKKKE